MRGEFTGELITRLVLTDGARAAELVEPLSYTTHYGLTVTCPPGMRTDLATLPGIARLFFTKLDRTTWAAVIHDRLINTRDVTRCEADFIFHEALITSGVGPRKAWLYWLGVRLWGILTHASRTSSCGS